MNLTERWEQLGREAFAIPHDPGRVTEREPLLIERLRVAESFGLDDSRLEESHANLLHFYYCDISDRAKAELLCRYWIALKHDQLTASRHDLQVLYELGLSLWINGRQSGSENASGSAEAEEQYRRALRLVEHAYGVGDPRTDGPIFQLAQYLHNAKQHDEALLLGERLLALRASREQSEASRSQATAPWFMRDGYVALGRLADAEAFLRQEIASQAQREEEGRRVLSGGSLSQLADVIADQGRLDEAMDLKLEAVTLITADFDAMIARHEQARAKADQLGVRTAGPLSRSHEMYVRCSYGNLLRRAGRLDEAEIVYRDVLIMHEVEAQHPPSSWHAPPALARAYRAASNASQRGLILEGLAPVLLDAGRTKEAASLAAEAAQLKSAGAELRERANRISERRSRREWRGSQISLEDLRQLLDASGRKGLSTS